MSGRSWVRSPTASYQRRYKMVPDASLLGAQHIRIGLASLSSLNSIWNERSRVILVGITCFAIDHKQISLNQIHVHLGVKNLFVSTNPTDSNCWADPKLFWCSSSKDKIFSTRKVHTYMYFKFTFICCHILYVYALLVFTFNAVFLSLVHTVPDFSPGVATVWTPGPTGTHRDYAVATPASTALNRDTPC